MEGAMAVSEPASLVASASFMMSSPANTIRSDSNNSGSFVCYCYSNNSSKRRSHCQPQLCKVSTLPFPRGRLPGRGGLVHRARLRVTKTSPGASSELRVEQLALNRSEFAVQVAAFGPGIAFSYGRG